MWVLIILAVHINNPEDVPGRVTLKFETESACRQARESLQYKLKFDTFKVISECKRS